MRLKKQAYNVKPSLWMNPEDKPQHLLTTVASGFHCITFAIHPFILM